MHQLSLQGLFKPDRWPRRPYCADDLTAGLRIRSLEQALTRPYIQANPPHLRVWSIHDCDYPGAALAWETANLPPPAWAACNRANAHAHLVWGLSAPVLVEGLGARDAPLRYLAAVESCMRERLHADPGYSGLITKNPAHPLWRVLRGPRIGYELAELAEYLPELDKHRPKQRIEQVGLGRNVTLFDWLRRYAYRNIRRYKLDVRNYVLWQSHLNGRALERNGDFATPLDPREVWYVAKSVAKWTWHRFDIEASDARFAGLQSERGRRGGLAKGRANDDKRASARLMAAQGYSVRAIAQALGVSIGSVSAWCRCSDSHNQITAPLGGAVVSVR